MKHRSQALATCRRCRLTLKEIHAVFAADWHSQLKSERSFMHAHLWLNCQLEGVFLNGILRRDAPSSLQVGTTACAAARAAKASSRIPTTLLWLSSV